MFNQRKILFIDRDGTLINEPADEQIDSIDKLELMPGVIEALIKLKQAGFVFVMITNQDGLGTNCFPEENFWPAHNLMLKIFKSQGITFESVRICPHFEADNCDCRKPKLGLVMDYMRDQTIDRNQSHVIGDRQTDVMFAENLGVNGILFEGWESVVEKILTKPRIGRVTRTTNETQIEVQVNLDSNRKSIISTEVGFFDHMLEQIAAHAGIEMNVKVKGDLQIDEHHTVEDTAITLGLAIKKALADKFGIARYGFVLPMDEAVAQISIDFSGRPYCTFNGVFNREKIGDLSTELVSHFFQSLSVSLGMTINISVTGENAHHMIESCFKGFGRCLRQAIMRVESKIPTTKGML